MNLSIISWIIVLFMFLTGGNNEGFNDTSIGEMGKAGSHIESNNANIVFGGNIESDGYFNFGGNIESGNNNESGNKIESGGNIESVQMNIPEAYRIGGFATGLQAYTFNRYSLMEAIEKTAQAGGRVLEMYPGQQLSPEQPDVRFTPDVSDEIIAKVRAKLEEHDILPVNFGVIRLANEESEMRKVFEFAGKLGVKSITTEPSPESMDLIERMVQEYDIMVAIHNHPRRPDDPDYRLWDPEYVLSLVEDRDHRIGACADIGHWIRSGIKAVDGLRVLEGRIISLHFTDVNRFGPEGTDTIAGTGVAELSSVLDELERQNFGGHLSIEYETNWYENVTDVAHFIGFIRGWAETRQN